MAYEQNGSRRLSPVVGVVAVHALIGYALISGLAMNVARNVIPSFRLINVDEPPVPPEREEPKPQKVERATPADRPFVPKPAIADLPPTTVDTLTPQPDSFKAAEQVVQQDVTPPPPPPSKATGPQVGRGRAGWITTEDYPAAAIRAGEEGTVGVSVTIDMAGRVSGCTVTASSGHANLDAITCRLYQRRARFSPALDIGGMPVPSSYADRVRWQLPAQ